MKISPITKNFVDLTRKSNDRNEQIIKQEI